MVFRNLTLIRLPNGISASPEALAQQLAKAAFRPCEASERFSAGWVSPNNGDNLVYAQGQQRLLCLQTEAKILPAAYVRREAASKLAQIERAQGFKPGRKQIREIREQVELELIPRAFTKLSRTLAWIDNTNGWMAIDGSASRCDDVIEYLKLSMDMLPQMAQPKPQVSPSTAMTHWLAAGEAPEQLTIDRECELQASAEERAAVRYTRHNLDSEEVRAHIASGKSAKRIALTWNDRVSFVLTESMELKRIAFLDIIKEEAARQGEDSDGMFATNFALATGELAQVVQAVMAACGGEVEPMAEAA